jgi:hypothetical protein
MVYDIFLLLSSGAVVNNDQFQSKGLMENARIISPTFFVII